MRAAASSCSLMSPLAEAPPSPLSLSQATAMSANTARSEITTRNDRLRHQGVPDMARMFTLLLVSSTVPSLQ